MNKKFINPRSCWQFITITEKGVIKQIVNGSIYQPATHFAGGNIKWFDDTKLLKHKPYKTICK